MFKQSLITMAILSFAGTASAIELTDFKDPNTTYDEAFIDFSAIANSGNQDQASYSTFLDGFYKKRSSTERQVWGITVDGNADASRGPNDDDESVNDFGYAVRANTDVLHGLSLNQQA